MKDGFVWGQLLPAPLPPALIEHHLEEDGDDFFVFNPNNPKIALHMFVNNLYNFATNLLNAIYRLRFHGCNYEMRKLAETVVGARFN